MNYAIGRNCRFLQGPRTNPNSVRRLAEAVRAGKETTEVFVNYRRDGSPFMNLLMIAPLMDSRGTIRYFIGAQTDVSGLLKNCTDLEALQNLVERAENPVLAAAEDEENHKDELQALTEMFNATELDTVRKFGGSMHREHADESDRESIASHRPRLVLKDRGTEVVEQARSREELNPDGSVRLNGRLPGVYQNVRFDHTATIVQHRKADLITVSPRSPRALPPYPLHIALPSRPWNPTITFPVPYRWLLTRP